MKHRISRRAFLNGCTLLAAAAAVSSLTSCGEKKAKDSGLAQIVVGSDTYPPYIYLNNDGIPSGIDVEIATEAFRRMGYAARFEVIDWEQKTALVESGAISYKFVQNVKEQLNKVGCRILGCVLNKVNTKKNPYYGKYYGHYYGNYYGNGQDGTEETQEDLTPDAGSKSDGTAAETKTAVPGQNTGEKESAK